MRKQIAKDNFSVDKETKGSLRDKSNKKNTEADDLLISIISIHIR